MSTNPDTEHSQIPLERGTLMIGCRKRPFQKNLALLLPVSCLARFASIGKKRRWLEYLILLTAACGAHRGNGAIAGDLPARESSVFEYTFEGQLPLMHNAGRINLGAGYFTDQIQGERTRITSDGESAKFDSPPEGGLLLRNPFWETDADHAGGWTWEIRLKVAPSNTTRCFQVRIGDATAHADRPHVGLQFWLNRIDGFKGTTLAKIDLTDEFATLRVAQPPGSDTFHFWLNGRPIDFDGTSEQLSYGDSSWIGDGSSSTAGVTIVDYIRWTGQGAFAPPAEGSKSADLEAGASRIGSSASPALVSREIADSGGYRSERRAVPNFGLMLNDDGDVSFPSSDPELARLYRQAMIRAFSGTPAKTLMYSVGMGSDTLYYPTGVASVVGWRKTKYDTFHEVPSSEEQMWAQRIQNITNGIHAGVDPVRVSGEQARSLGIAFVPSYRMNDDHFMFDPLEYPMTGKFWLDNHERLKIRQSPILSDPRYGQLLDYSHEEVRDFRLAVIFEVIERYQDLMEGLELDFNRVQVFFPHQQAEERSHLMTDLLSKVRRRLDETGRKNNRTYYLIVRVPPTLKNCRWAGLDIAEWLERHLVDVLIPAQLMTLAHDMPVDEFVKLAEPHGAQVYPAIYPRTGYTWPLSDGTEAGFRASPAAWAPPELFRGAAANYWRMGAAGFQLFNYRPVEVPFSDHLYRTMRDLADPAGLSLSDRTYAVTPGYYLDYEDTYQYRKQLPLDIKPGDTHQLRMFVGDDPGVAPAPDRILLRLGFRNASQPASLTLHFNDQVLYDGQLNDRLVETAGGPGLTPTHILQLPIDDPTLIQPEWNEIECRIQYADSPKHELAQVQRPAIQIVECQLGVIYAPRPNAIFQP